MIAHTDNLLKIQDSPPEHLKSWLSHQSSLTEKLKTLSGDAELEVLEQVWTRPGWWEKFRLGLTATPILHRNILMFSKQQPCWFARTIIPNDCYQNNSSVFDRLKHESLGSILFNNADIERLELHNYAINQRCLEYYWLPKGLQIANELYWLRFSIFNFPDKTCFYLIEILLPDLIKVIK